MKQHRQKRSMMGWASFAGWSLVTCYALFFSIAEAASKSSFLETIGVSTAVGAVLGASTLPFYDQPGSHLMNIAYGASLGVAVGVGWWIYEKSVAKGAAEPQGEWDRRGVDVKLAAGRLFAPVGQGSAAVSFPLVSLTW